MTNAVLAQFHALAAQEAETGIDMTEAVKGGGGRLLPEGYAFAQLVEYIELGKQPQEFQGKAKPAEMEVQLAFALTGQAVDPADPTKTIPYTNEDGTPYIVRPWSFALSRNEKSRAFLLFKALNWKGTAKNFAQLLGEKWLVKIVHTEKDNKKRSELDLKSFIPPLDPVSRAAYPIADADASLYKLFLWNRPTKAAWDSLFIEGQWAAKDGKPAESKNKLQETILGAVDFQGSALQALLGGAVTALPTAPTGPVAAPQVATPTVAPAAVAAPVVAAPVVPPAAVSAPVQAPTSATVGVVTPQPGTASAVPVVSAPVVGEVAAPLVQPAAPAVVQPAVVAPIATPAVVPAAVPSSVVLPA